jgi:hypothetical protein
MPFGLFKFRTVWRITPAVQISIIVSCYLLMILLGYFEYRQT